MPGNDEFTIKVRLLGKEWRDLYAYAVQVDMHKPSTASMAYFDFAGTVEVSVTYNRGTVQSARIRPLSYGIAPKVAGNTITLSLSQPRNISVEVNGDTLHNLHLFASAIETNRPDPKNPNVIYFGPGVHSPGSVLNVPNGKTVYIAGGAVVKTKLLCDKSENIRIIGRGVLYQAQEGIQVTFSKNVEIDGIIVVNPTHYTIFGGQSQNLTVRNLKSFSSKGWSDGIDLMSTSDVVIDGVFLRNSDDTIALYGHRWKYYGDTKHVVVRNSTLWADVAHPVNIGTHGDPANPEVIEDILFSNLDILEQDEPQIAYQGCFAINVSDENLVRSVRVENVRIEDFSRGQLVNLRVTFNKKYATAPGRGIEDISFRNVSYEGSHANLSIISGYNESRRIKGVLFEDLKINGNLVHNADQARFHVGEHVDEVVFQTTGDKPAAQLVAQPTH
jgi:hypothetical protein